MLLPGSKSLTNRDLILASLYGGTVKLRGYLESEDTLAMIGALRLLGISIEEEADMLIIEGGMHHMRKKEVKIYVHQSGTCMRFLTALASIIPGGVVQIYGDEKLNSRPMGPMVEALKEVGVKIDSTVEGNPPLTIYGRNWQTSQIHMNGMYSSQFFTGLLLVASEIKSGIEIHVEGDLVSRPYIDMTFRELERFGVKGQNEGYHTLRVFPCKRDTVNPLTLAIEGDASALSYIANIIVLLGGEIKIENLGSKTCQGDYKYLEILEKYFGLIWSSDGESTTLSSPGISERILDPLAQIDFEDMPDVSMSFMVLAMFLPGNTMITGLETLNLKESPRIKAMHQELLKFGISVVSDEKSITIGQYSKKDIKASIETYDDHRIAMSFGVLTLLFDGIEILNPDSVRKTYPRFWKDIKFVQNHRYKREFDVL